MCLYDLILTLKARIIVRCRRLELCRTGINHLECRMDAILISECLDIFCGLSRKPCDYIVRELYSLSL